jgi:hypothetical protein
LTCGAIVGSASPPDYGHLEIFKHLNLTQFGANPSAAQGRSAVAKTLVLLYVVAGAVPCTISSRATGLTGPDGW